MHDEEGRQNKQWCVGLLMAELVLFQWEYMSKVTKKLHNATCFGL
jgi:hypothetical protein